MTTTATKATTALDLEVDAQQQRDWSAGYGHAMVGRTPETLNDTLAPHYVQGYRAGRLAAWGA